MRILVIMEGFFPGKKYGGPPVSVDNFCRLMKEHQCFILATDHDLYNTERYSGIVEGWNERGNCKVRYVSDSRYNLFTFKEVIREVKPDLLYLQGLFQSCVYPCLILAKRMRIKVLLAPRGELCDGAINMKKYKKIPYIFAVRALGLTKNIHYQSTSQDEHDGIIKWLRVDEKRIHDLTNIPSLPICTYDRNKKEPGYAKLIFLSRVHPKKNLLAALQFLEHADGNIIFDIYGPIEDADYWAECQNETTKLGKSVVVRYKGLINHDDVHKTFSLYDAFIFPTLSENYGHVIIESLIVGTPVIISDGTPWTDVNIHNAGWSYKLSEKEEFIKAINRLMLFDNKEMEEISSNAKRYAETKLKIQNLRMEYAEALKSIYSL